MPRFGLGLITLACALTAAACAGTKATPAVGNDGGPTGAAGSGTGGAAAGGRGGGSVTGTGGPIIITGGTTGTGGMCVPSTACEVPGARYCGTVGAGCPGQKLECGACPGDGICEERLCVGGASCTPITCGNYCGTIGDGCGRKLDCTAACGAGQECRNGVCVDPGCVPLTCAAAGNLRYCGMIGDGCGGTLDCGTCPNGGTCGGTGGTPNVCNDPTCGRVSCTPTGGQYCGVIGNGCGGTQDCGACTNGMACPTTGASAHVCPGSMTTVPPTCSGATKTTISGTVYDPAGVNPLYNVIVYVPSGPLPALAEGASCERCGAQVTAPLAAGLTDTSGRFSITLEPVPSTTNVPLVMQVGKWRRQIMIPTLQTCRDNPLTDKNQTRLPRNSGEGHLPRIALTTGGSDALECFLRQVGISDSEFTNDAGNGRVHLYVGGDAAAGKGQGAASITGGGALRDATTLWRDANKMLGYDIIVHSCEGSQYANVKQPYIANVKRYADAGGRLFNSHLHFYWLRSGPAPWPTSAGYIGVGEPDPPSPVTATIDTTFAKGAAFGAWLMSTGATTTAASMQLHGSRFSVTTTTPPTSQRWLYIPASSTTQMSTQYLTIDTPVEAAATAKCGRVVLTDIHVKEAPPPSGSKDDSDPADPFPTGCNQPNLSAQGKALEFLFFDLSSCIEPPTSMPQPPIVPPPGTPTQPPPMVGQPPKVPPPPPPPPPPDPG
jgi:hypothetical protein